MSASLSVYILYGVKVDCTEEQLNKFEEIDYPQIRGARRRIRDYHDGSAVLGISLGDGHWNSRGWFGDTRKLPLEEIRELAENARNQFVRNNLKARVESMLDKPIEDEQIGLYTVPSYW